MTINTATELVRYIRHHIAGSEYQDVKAVEDFVAMRTKELSNRIIALEGTIDTLRELRKFDQNQPKDSCPPSDI